MMSDWYRTNTSGTYLVVPTGIPLSTLKMPDSVQSLLDERITLPFARNVDSHSLAMTFNRAGVDDCLKHSGFCVIRR